MRSINNRLALWAAGIAVAAAFWAPATAGAAALTVSPSAGSVNVGSTFSVSFGISGLSSAVNDSLSGFDFAVSYDAASVSLVGFSFIDSASGINQLDQPDPASFGFLGDAIDLGTSVRVSGLSGNLAAVLDALQADAFDFISLSFLALAPSTGALFAVDTADPTLLFVDSDVNELAVDVSHSSALFAIGSAGAVPEPSDGALVLVALGAAFAARRRSVRRIAAVAAVAGALAVPAVAADTAPAAAARTPLAGTVVQVQGQRMKVRTASGSEYWVTTGTPLTPQHTGKRVRGEARPVGDTVLVDKLVFE